MTLRVGFLISHPIQYYAPIFRELAKLCDLTVFFAHRQTAEQQAAAGFGVAFEWDVDLLTGFASRFLENRARLPSTDRFFGCDTPGVREEIVKGRFDAFVVPGWALLTYWQAVRACRRAGVSVLVRGDSQLPAERPGLRRRLKALAFPLILRQFDGYLFVGQRNRAYLAHYGAPAHRLFFSPHCVDNEAFARASALAQTPLAEPPVKRILFVGKLVARKRPLDLVQAAARLRACGHRVVLAFAGSGELATALAEAAAAAGVPAEFLGFVNQSAMPQVMAAADVIALPSDGTETWGLVVNEAMACGVPAVVSDVVGCGPDLIQPGATGAVFPCGDIAAMADAIEATLAIERHAARRRLAELMGVYSPRRAAEGVIEAANSLHSALLVE